MDKTSYAHVSPPPPYYGPQNQSTPGPPMAPQTHIIQPVVINRQFGPNPMRLECPACRDTVITRVEVVPSTKTHLLAALICIFGGICCFCIPYCVDSCQNITHYCPSCNTFIGTYSS